MREPYEVLLGHFKGHYSMGPHLQGAEPDWAALTEPKLFDNLSNGERKMIQVGLAIWSGDSTATVASLAGLDNMHLKRVFAALWASMINPPHNWTKDTEFVGLLQGAIKNAESVRGGNG